MSRELLTPADALTLLKGTEVEALIRVPGERAPSWRHASFEAYYSMESCVVKCEGIRNCLAYGGVRKVGGS